MDKLLYVTFVDFDDTRFAGVAKKIRNQIKVFEAAGHPVTLVSRYGSGVAVWRGDEMSLIRSDLNVFSRKVLTTAAYAQVTKGGYGYCYIRFQFFCGNVYKMLSRLRQHGIRTIVEIPTFPYDNELKMQGLRGIPKIICDRWYRRLCPQYIDRFTTYCNDTEIYGVPAIALSNGIIVDSVPETRSTVTNGFINILSVSSMLPWHGIDRAINGIAKYYESGGNRSIHLHIAGEGKDRDVYEALVKKHGLDTRVTFHGPTYGDALDDLFDRCTVGLCALGVHRRGKLNGSPLKTVEYVARGLAVASEMELDFLPKGTEFLYSVAPDESPLDISALIEWHDNLMKDGEAQVHSRIRQYAREHCDMTVTMSKVIEYYHSK